MSISSQQSADEILSNLDGWRLIGAYRANFSDQEYLDLGNGNPSSNSMALHSKSLARFWQSRLLLGINSRFDLRSSLRSSASHALIDATITTMATRSLEIWRAWNTSIREWSFNDYN